jgi:Lysophospholipase L1 and related esterases
MTNYPQKKSKFNFYCTIACVSIVVLMLYYTGTQSINSAQNPFMYVDIKENTQIEHIPSDDIVVFDVDYDVTLSETDDAGQEYIDSIIFLGDSLTYGLRSYAMLKDGKDTKQVWTPVSGTLTLSQANIINILFPDTNTEITIEEAVKIKKPPILIISIGVNGVSFMSEEYFKNEYIKLVKTIQASSPETIIILQSIFPVAKSYPHQNSISMEKIITANEWINTIANETDVKYLNTFTALIGDDGYLPETYQNGDGMHFNEVGFETVLNYIRTHAYAN